MIEQNTFLRRPEEIPGGFPKMNLWETFGGSSGGIAEENSKGSPEQISEGSTTSSTMIFLGDPSGILQFLQ